MQVTNFSDQDVADTVSSLWPGRSIADVLSEVARLAGYDPLQGTGLSIVSSSGSLRRSWLLRHPAVGLTLVERNVTSECISSSRPWCYGTDWDETARYAPTRDAAFQSIQDLSVIFETPCSAGFRLSVFPIPNKTYLTASINSVFDHSAATPTPYCADNRVVAYTGEEGQNQYGSDLVGNVNGCGNLYGFKKDAVGSAFSVGGQYVGGGTPQYLYYDGHPGYDYRTTAIDQCPGGTVTTDCPTGTRGQIRIRAAASGTVKRLYEPYGRIELDHGNGYETWYMHLSRFDVTVGQLVSAGDYIGIAGDTGATGNPHLHFEVRTDGIPTDPYGWSGTGVDPYTRAQNTFLW